MVHETLRGIEQNEERRLWRPDYIGAYFLMITRKLQNADCPAQVLSQFIILRCASALILNRDPSRNQKFMAFYLAANRVASTRNDRHRHTNHIPGWVHVG